MYPDYVITSVSSERQVHVTLYTLTFAVLSTLCHVPCLSSLGLTSAYFISFRSNTTGRSSRAEVSGILSPPLDVPQGCVLGLLLFNIFIHDIWNVITHYIFLIFVDTKKNVRAVNSFDDCTQSQSDTDTIQGWCTANSLTLHLCEARAIIFSQKKN
jgi:hypothetical protein